MSIVGRVLESLSRAANTGMHSTSDVPGLGASAEFTVFMWVEDLGSNSNDTVWADDNGGCQIFLNSSTNEIKARYSNSSSGGTGGDMGAGWNAVCVQMGLNISGSNDVVLTVYRTASSDVDGGNEINSSGGGGPNIESDSVHYILGDDAGGSPSDDGCAARIANLCLVEGLWTLDELGVDTTTGQAKAFDSGAEAAIIYAIRGIEGTVGFDDSGNGNHFTVESGGVTHDESDLPPGMSAPSAGADYELTAGAVSVSSSLGSPAVSQAHDIGIDALASATAIAPVALSQAHDLSTASLTSSTTVAAPEVSQNSEITAASVVSATAVAEPVATQVHDLSPDSLTSASTTAALATSQVHGLAVEALASDSSLGAPSVTEIVAGNYTAASVELASTIEEPSATQVHDLGAVSIASGSSIGSPAASSVSGFTANGLASGSSIATPIATQAHQIISNALAAASAIQAPVATQDHQFAATALASAGQVEAPNLSGTHNIAVSSLACASTIATPAGSQNATPTLGDAVDMVATVL